MATEQINIFEKTITEQLLGPGSDIFNDNKEQEIIISAPPLQRYYTGILFPKQDLATQGDADEIASGAGDSDDESNINIDDNTDKGDTNIDDNIGDENLYDNRKKLTKKIKYDGDETSLSNHFFPTDMGISFCVKDDVNSIDVGFSFAIYKQPKQTEIKLKTTQHIYNVLMGDKYGFPFKDILNYKKIDAHYGYLSINRELKGKKMGRTEEYKQFDTWQKTLDPDIKEAAEPAADKFSQLIGPSWQRNPVKISKIIEIGEIPKPLSFSEFKYAGYTVKTYKKNDKKYVKIQLVNMANAIDKK